MPKEHLDADDLLRPREVADLLGVRTSTIARWARGGKLTPLRTPGGHRRYSRAEIRRLLTNETPRDAQQQLAEDAARLYDQG
jgi:excisionase family DNA binding protein